MSHLSHKELLNRLDTAEKLVEVGAIYTHYKNSKVEYRVSGLSFIEATDAIAVVYEAVADPRISFIRPITNWLQYVLNDTHYVQRFTKK
jgi:hypothetical protein